MISAAEQELMRGVIAAPDDDAPRLVLADWLSQRGEPRGELIVTACMLGRPDLPIGTRRALIKRHDTLLQDHGRRWLAELGLQTDQGRFVRGMVEEVQGPLSQLMASFDALFASTPVRSLRVIDVPTGAVRLLRFSPHMARLHTLTIDKLEAAAVPALLDSDGLNEVRHLSLRDSVLGDDAVQELVTPKRLEKLQSLCLNRVHMGTAGAVFVAEASTLPNLTNLDLTTNDIHDAGARALAISQSLRPLRALSLNQNGLTAVGAIAIADTPYLTQLTSLDLGFNNLKDEGVRALSRSMGLSNLTRLCLDRTNLTEHGARALAASEKLPKLATLELEHNYLPPAAQTLLRAHFAERVRL